MILIVAGTVTAVLGEYVDSAVIFGVVIINAVVGYLQEAKAVQAIEALSRSMTSEATVIREGRRLRLPAAGLVPGDLVVLQAGDKVPADLRLSYSRDLHVDESALTGESVPVEKQVDALPEDAGLADRTNMAYASTLVTSGQGTGVVVATGDVTEVGKISGLIAAGRGAEDAPHAQDRPVQSGAPLRHHRPGRHHCRGGHPARRTGGGHVPGGRGAGRGSHPRRPACSRDHRPRHRGVADGPATGDHPQAARRGDAGGHHGHLLRQDGHAHREPDDRAEGRRRATRLRADGCGLRSARRTARLRGPGETGARVRGGPTRRVGGPAELLRAGLLCNDSSLYFEDGAWHISGDPTEAALLVAAIKAGLDRESLEHALPRLDTIPFESEHQFMATLHRDWRLPP